ncbi:MAG: ATP-binding protein [bacterium]
MSEIDFLAVFEGMLEPAAICDDDGNVHVMNAAARALLEPQGDVRLTLTARETVRQMRVRQIGETEFFMADVAVEGALRRSVSVSLYPLQHGGYRVSFSSDVSRGLPANVRILQALVNAHRHSDLFKTSEKIAALFASCFTEVFPDYSFQVWFDRASPEAFAYAHSPWHAEPSRLMDGKTGSVSATDCVFDGSGIGWAHEIVDATFGTCRIQVEKRSDSRFSVAERAAFETFLQQLAFALFRMWHSEDLSAVTPILDHLDAVVIVCDARRKIRVANKTFEELVYDENLVGRDILDFFSESSRTKLRTASASIMAGGTAKPFEAALVNADGESSSQVILTIQVAPSPGQKTSGFVVLGQHNEMSLVQLEERLSQAEHLMNIGQLATGVAHELKNPLTTILNYADYLLRKYDDQFFEVRDRERLQRIVSGVEHIDAFVRDLMTLARPDGFRDESVELRAVIAESMALCDPTLRSKRTSIAIDIEEGTVVKGSPMQLKQVFVNLFNNAANAMPAGRDGSIRVTAKPSEADVLVEVVDNADGIPQEVLAHIFEPFFTTRDGAGGTGLGLAIVDSVVRRHRGTISVQSALGKGTTFTIVLPRGV